MEAPKQLQHVVTRRQPEFWRDVVGQDELVAELQRLILADDMPGVLLLVGPWGAGTTTLARLVAKTTACEGRKADEAEPCGRCPPCKEFVGQMSCVNSEYLSRNDSV